MKVLDTLEAIGTSDGQLIACTQTAEVVSVDLLLWNLHQVRVSFGDWLAFQTNVQAFGSDLDSFQHALEGDLLLKEIKRNYLSDDYVTEALRKYEHIQLTNCDGDVVLDIIAATVSIEHKGIAKAESLSP